MANEFKIVIRVDGKDAEKDAGKVRVAIEDQLSAITIRGEIDIAGLEQTSAMMAKLRSDAGSLGRAMAKGLSDQFQRATDLMSNLRSEIGGIVRASDDLTDLDMPLSEDVEKLLSAKGSKALKAISEIEKVTASLNELQNTRARILQTKVTPLAGGIGVPLQRLAKGWESGYKGYITRVRKQIDQEIRATEIEVEGRQVNLIAEIKRREAIAKKEAAAVLPDLEQAALQARERMDAALADQPQMSSLVPSTSQAIGEWDRAADTLVAEYQKLEAQLVDATAETAPKIEQSMARVYGEISELQLYEPTEDVREWVGRVETARAEVFETERRFREAKRNLETGDVDELKAQLDLRIRALEAGKAEELTFYREFTMDRDELITRLEQDGQEAAAKAIKDLQAVNDGIAEEERRRATLVKKLQEGTTTELPKGAKGTLVDFVTVEKALGEQADIATKAFDDQRLGLQKWVKQIDIATYAARGLDEAQRYAAARLEKSAQREIRKRTPARVGLEEAAEIDKEVYGRLQREIAGLSAITIEPLRAANEAHKAQLTEMAQQTEIFVNMMRASLSEDITEGQEQEAKGLLRLWEWISDKLVGNSVIPDMVNAINDWLDLVGQDADVQNREQIQAAEEKARILIDLAETEAKAKIEAEKRVTNEASTQNRIRLAQKKGAVTRANVRQRGKTTLEVAEGRVELKELDRQNKLLADARKLAGELGVEWADVAAGMEESGTSLEVVVGELKRLKAEQADITRQARARAKLEDQAKASAQAIGVSWRVVEDAMNDTGAEMGDVVRQLRRAEGQQQQLWDDARRISEEYRGLPGAVRLFNEELENSRRARQGLFEISRDMQDIGNSIRMNAGIVTGAVTVAGRDYLQFAKQSDVAARSLALNADLTQELRQLTVEQSTALAVLDPETTARGITVWAQATGQQIENQQQLNDLLAQTVPIQQAAALSQTDIATLSDAAAGALNQYGLELEDTTKVVAIFNKVSDDTLAEVSDVAEAFKYVGPTADRAGESIEQTATAFAILGDNGIRGTQAGTSYGRMLENLLVPNSKEAEDVFQRLFGSSSPFFDAQGQYIGTARAVDMLAAATEKMNDQEREAALAAIFDTNARRAATVLIRKQTEARVEGVNLLERESAGLAGDALEVWRTQVEDWEESDVYRVQQAQMRWQAFWLTVGQQGLDAALPYLEKASKFVEGLVSTVKANPWLTEVVLGVATGGIVIGTVITAVGTLSKTALTIQTVFQGIQTTFTKRATAEQRFQSTVVSSAEQFKRIVLEAAGQEATIEKQSATDEAAIEKKSALNVSSILGTALTALAVGETLSRTLTGQGLAGWFTEKEGVQAGETRLLELADLEAPELQDELSQLRSDLQMLRSLTTTERGKEGALLFDRDYWKQIFGYGTAGIESDDSRLSELFGGGVTGRFRSLSGTALADKVAELETIEAGLVAQLTRNVYAEAAQAQQLEDLEKATAGATSEIYNHNQAVQDLGRNYSPEQIERAVNIYADMLMRQEEALTEFNTRISDLNRDLAADLASMATDYQQDRIAAERSFHEETAQMTADFQRQQQRATDEHLTRMARAEEDHYMTLWDLSLSRDAAGIYKENQRFAVEQRRAEEDFATQQNQASQDFAIEQAQRQQQHAMKMAELAQQYALEREQRIAEHAAAVAQAKADHEAEMERLRAEYFDKLNAELNYYTQSQHTQAVYQAAMLGDLTAFLQQNRSIWQQHVASLPTPSGYGGYGGYGGSGSERFDQYAYYSGSYQSGGYIPKTGMALVHKGEFVMSAQTTRQVEGVMGTLNQGKLSRGGGVNIPVAVQVDGMGLDARAVARIAGEQVAAQLYDTLTQVAG